jgi:hypothetical protein
MSWIKKEQAQNPQPIQQNQPLKKLSDSAINNDIESLKKQIAVLEKKEKEIPSIQEIEAEEEPKTKHNIKEKFMVVKEIPVQEIREVKDKDGNVINFITNEEALTLLLERTALLLE